MKGEDLAISVRIITRPAAERICRAAFEHAKKFGYKNVTICEKPNVLRETSGLMEEVAKQVAKDYPGIPLWSTNIDAQTMWLTKNPEEYGVIVASNLFGDVISDAFAGLIGGLGFAASGNIGEEVAVFEPTHGSAPKYADTESADRESDRDDSLRGHDARPHRRDRQSELDPQSHRRRCQEGKVRTYDMMRISGGAKAISQGAASTTQMTDGILYELEKIQARELAVSAR